MRLFPIKRQKAAPSATLARLGAALTGLAVIASAGAASAEASRSAADCEAIGRMTPSGARITEATVVAAGGFKTEDRDLARRSTSLGAFCRVRIQSAPSPSSDIGIEVWLPMSNWNGRFLGTGNGGGAGTIAYGMGMVEGLKRGFAVANTDMGTVPDINTTNDQPERWIDFGYRATHEMTRLGKTVVSDFYKTDGFRAYFAGCSTGGQQALGTALRYPDDYDGILAGDPGNNRTHVATSFLWNYNALNATPASALTAANWSMVSKAVLAACGGRDGGAAGDLFLTDPRQCRFDVASLPACEGDVPNESCLTAPQRTTLRKLYAGAVNPRTGERIYAGMALGSEDQPLGPLMQGDPAVWPAQQFYPFHWALDPAFRAENFDFDRDLDRIDARLAGTLNANSVDFADFERRGGKLILYTGLADPAVPFEEVVNYYDRLAAARGGVVEAQNFARLFLVPGMGHCFGGPGATDFGQPFTDSASGLPETDILMALVAWTETGSAPQSLTARHPDPTPASPVDRPICAYPALPTHNGGDPRRAEAFTCRAGPEGGVRAPAPRYLN